MSQFCKYIGSNNMERNSDCLSVPRPCSPGRYLESAQTNGPATKHVLYVEVVPKGFLKMENNQEDEALDSMRDPLLPGSLSPQPDPKRKVSKQRLERRKGRREKKHRERRKRKGLTDPSQFVGVELGEEIKLEMDVKLNSVDGGCSPYTFPSPHRCSSSDEEVVPKRKPARRKKETRDYTTLAFGCNRLSCSFRTTSISELNEHKLNGHQGQRIFKCDQCAYCGSTASDLRKHYRQHSGEIPYMCKVKGCSYSAKHNNSLVYHTKKYHPTGEPLLCDAPEGCSFSTYLNSALKHHKMMVHGNGKTLACEICAYKCYLMADLRKHQRVHTGENPYSCDFTGCSYSCKISSNLKKHKRIHTEEKPYFCDACDFRTNFINSLKVHKRTHTNEKPYTCEQCGYCCNHTSNLKKHVARVHPGAQYRTMDQRKGPSSAEAPNALPRRD